MVERAQQCREPLGCRVLAGTDRAKPWPGHAVGGGAPIRDAGTEGPVPRAGQKRPGEALRQGGLWFPEAEARDTAGTPIAFATLT